MLGVALATGPIARAAQPTFADLLARAKAEAEAGHRWGPPGDNLADTIMMLFQLAPSATPDQLAAFADLLERDRKNLQQSPVGAPPAAAPSKPPVPAVADIPPAAAPAPATEMPPPVAAPAPVTETPPGAAPPRHEEPAVADLPSATAPPPVAAPDPILVMAMLLRVTMRESLAMSEANAARSL
jgi:hypothetical protein